MRILVITQYYWPEEFRINDLVTGLQQRGHNLTVLTGLPNYPTGKYFSGYSLASIGEQKQNGIIVIRSPIIPRGKGRGWQLALNYLSFAITASFFGLLYCKEKYDLIFVFEPSPVTVALPGIFLKWVKKIPMMFWVQDLWPESLIATGAVKKKCILNSIRKMVDFIYKNSDQVLIQSQAFRDHVLAANVDDKSIRYFPNWAEELYHPFKGKINDELKEELPKGFLIMFAGNIGAAQSFETIIEAAEELKYSTDIHWVILGDGLRMPWVENQVKAKDLSSNFHLLGRKPMASMSAYFSESDALLVTLRNEPVFSLTIPSKIQSYLACGKPIIASLPGIGNEVIKESGAGICAFPGDGKSLANSVMRLYKMGESERNQMGKLGRSFFLKNFERNMLVDRLEVWMKEIKEKQKCEY